MSNIIQGALAVYGRYTPENKQQVSVLAAQLLDVMTQGEGAGMKAVTRGEMSVKAPSQALASTAPKARSKPRRERLAIRKNCRALQRVGLSQEVTCDNYTAIANPSRVMPTCRFCLSNH